MCAIIKCLSCNKQVILKSYIIRDVFKLKRVSLFLEGKNFHFSQIFSVISTTEQVFSAINIIPVALVYSVEIIYLPAPIAR